MKDAQDFVIFMSAMNEYEMNETEQKRFTRIVKANESIFRQQIDGLRGAAIEPFSIGYRENARSGVKQMNQQCGNCKWWDRDNIIGTTSRTAQCLALVPDCARVIDNSYMGETEGQNCPVYEERKECEE